MQSSFTIRKAIASDIDELARLRWDFSPDEVAASQQTFESFLQDFSKFFKESLEQGNWTVWVAEHQHKLVGNIYVERVGKVPRPGRPNARWGYVTNVYADPSFRGEGLGTKLMQAVIDEAKSQELEFLIVWPSDEAINFYQRLGFKLSEEAMELELD